LKQVIERALKKHNESLTIFNEKQKLGLTPKETQFEVMVNGRLENGHQSIQKCKDGIKKLDEELKQIETNEKWFKTNSGYTENQYESLKQLLYEIGKRYGYNVVASHHRLGPTSGKYMKSDPGMYFDWNRITGVLLPGSLDGNEKDGAGDEKEKWYKTGGAKGGMYTVNNRGK
jgi:hypothetical protein